MLTEEICRIAVMQDGYSLRYVEPEFITEELCKLALCDKHESDVLQWVPEQMKTLELCKFAIEQSIDNFPFIPEEIQTEELKPLMEMLDKR